MKLDNKICTYAYSNSAVKSNNKTLKFGDRMDAYENGQWAEMLTSAGSEHSPAPIKREGNAVSRFFKNLVKVLGKKA